MNLKFKDRIAFLYLVSTAVILLFAFGTTFFLVREAVMNEIDRELTYQALKHQGEIFIKNDSLRFLNRAEWEEREHTQVQVNPLFVQIIDKNGRLLDRSPNLKEDTLAYEHLGAGGHYNSFLNDQSIRQAQLALEENGKVKGYLLVAISLEFARITISKLKTVLFFFYFFILFVLFFVSRFLAGRSIVPIQNLTRGISQITKENLNERIPLPEKKDEIFDLSHNFNELLERIEQAVEREKQFTSDASHELRTPLASIKGQLEVLIRKPRQQEEYEDRIRLGLAEIDKMGFILDQLLLLARLDSHKVDEKKRIALPTLIDESLSQFKNAIQDKGLRIELNCDPDASSLVPQYYSKLIVDNILSNAIKYSPENSAIKISVEELDGRIICTIEDSGIGIRDQDLRSIFENFFRSAPLDHKQIQGFGLGLSIVKKSAEAIGATIEVSSALGEGTTFRITF